MAREIHGFGFVLDEELSEADLVAVVVTTPSGQRLQLWAEVELSGRTLTLRQFAIYGPTVAGGEHGARGDGGVRCRSYPR